MKIIQYDSNKISYPFVFGYMKSTIELIDASGDIAEVVPDKETRERIRDVLLGKMQEAIKESYRNK